MQRKFEAAASFVIQAPATIQEIDNQGLLWIPAIGSSPTAAHRDDNGFTFM